VSYSYLHGGENSNVVATEVYVSTNEFVEEGDLLVRIAGSDVTQLIQNEVDAITNAYEEIESIYKKIDKISELTSKLMVTAPTDGMVAYVNYREGDEIIANEQSDQWSLMLMDVYNTDEMYIYTTVSDLDVLYIAQDAPVTVTVDALPGETFEGKVMRLDSYTDYRTGETVYNVQIKVEGREGLRPGMNTNCFVDSGESLDTLLVPIEAVFEENGKQMVEVLVGENEVEAVEIEVGLMNDMYVEVLSGLEEGQLVVTGSTKDLMPSQSVPENGSILPVAN
jgi:HlyD family secretion protein